MKKFFVTMSILGLLSLLISCGDIADSSADKAAPNGKARVSFSLGQIANRVIDPVNITAEDISHLELTAQKLSDEDKYEPYKFGESEALSWESISIMETASVTLDFGTYNFTLKLYTLKEDGETEFVVQTAKLEAQTIDFSTKTLEFNAEYKDSGDVKITVSWNLLEDAKTDPCRIKKIESEFYTLDSFGKDLANGIEKQAFGITINDEEFLKIASASYTEVPNGSYIIKLFLYNSATATKPFDTITDIIKVNGYKTLYDLKLDPNDLNVQYEAVFDPNGGAWEDGSTGAKAVLRNAYSGFIPPEDDIKHSTDDGLGLVGWYTFPDDRIPENPEELGISGGTSYEKIKREDYAQDYKFFAIWGKKTGGKLIKDNRALIIKTDIVDGKLYQNSKINLSVTDSDGKTVTDAIKYDAKILYKGKDINGLTDGAPYYLAEGKEIFLRGLENPIPKEKYQLYVTASRDMTETEQVSSSQTFDVELVEGLATPETQVALYNYDYDSDYNYNYYYYLTNSDYVGAELGTANLTSNRNIIAFDAQGNFYTANFDSSGSNPTVTVYSDVLDAAGIELTIKEGTTNFTGGFKSFVIDLATNTAYAWTVSSSSGKYTWYLFKYPNLISEGRADNPDFWASVQEEEGNFVPEQISINSNILYVLGTESGKDKMYVYDVSSDSATKLTSSGVDVTTYITGTIGFSSSATVTDIYALEGAVYLLVSDSSFSGDSSVWSSTNNDIYKRGSVIKYVPPATAGEGGTFDYLKKDTKTSVSLANTDIPKMALYITAGLNSFMYSDGEGKNLYPMIGSKHSKQGDDGVLINTYFPNVYAIKTAEDSALSSPQKVVAVKPKKLVIADDGIAFYTDTEGFLLFKNTNRVVTIDLAKFVIESVQTTEAKFASEISTYLNSDISLDTIRSGGTYYDYNASVWYFESSNRVYESDINLSGEDSGYLYLSIKEDK